MIVYVTIALSSNQFCLHCSWEISNGLLCEPNVFLLDIDSNSDNKQIVHHSTSTKWKKSTRPCESISTFTSKFVICDLWIGKRKKEGVHSNSETLKQVIILQSRSKAVKYSGTYDETWRKYTITKKSNERKTDCTFRTATSWSVPMDPKFIK